MKTKKVKWRWDYGVYIPVCPYCDEPAYYEDKCCFCGLPYKWVDKSKNTTVSQGEYTVVQVSNNSVYLYKGDACVMHCQCTKKQTKSELLEYIKLYEGLRSYEK